VRSKLEGKKKKVNEVQIFRGKKEIYKLTSELAEFMNHVRFAKFALETKTLRPKLSKEGGGTDACFTGVCLYRHKISAMCMQTEVITQAIRNFSHQLGPRERSTNQ
jgi:hypothetical protein